MMLKLQKFMKTKKGFTLVEVIVVLVILAILAAISIPALTGYISKANEKAAIADARTAYVAMQTIASELYSLKVTDTNTQTYFTAGTKGAGTVAGEVPKAYDTTINSLTGAGFKNNPTAVDVTGGKVVSFTMAVNSGKTVTYSATGFVVS